MLTVELASQLARLPLDGLHREHPNHIQHVIASDDDVKPPRELHPAFYGCFDWHSSVHGHWMLVRLLKRFPQLPEARAIRDAIDATITPQNIAVETAYFRGAGRQSFERMYGWAWLLQLAAELHGWESGAEWARSLAPLVDEIVARAHVFLPKQTYPIRTGVHPNTAFALGLMIDYARIADNRAFEALLVERARTYFANDTDIPAHLEPGGEDFFSPSLLEADLMRRVLSPADFAPWLAAFFPRGLPPSLANPAIVVDRHDPKLAHLDGLNTSRAWCMRAIASALPPSELQRAFAASADIHAREGLAHVATGDYAGEHWLATFAIYLLAQ
jgi:hypothetical protein